MLRKVLVFSLGVFVLPYLAAAAAPPPGPQERCAVCGMYVAPHQGWIASMKLADGSRLYFDGPKDLFTCFFELGRYRAGLTSMDVVEIEVTDYYTTRPVSAYDVFFVGGSNVLGPMGQELVPVRGRQEAETFRRDHGGKLMILKGDQLLEAPPQP